MAGNEQTAGADLPTDNGADLQTQIQAALNQQQADFFAQFERETGHKDVKSLLDFHQLTLSQSQAQANGYKTKYEKLQIDAAILAETAQAVSPTIVKDLLAGKASCDENGIVTIDGKPVADAIKQLLDANPFLAKAQGGTGSGAPASSSAPSRKMGRDEFNRLSPAERQKFLKDGGAIA